ncbi:uncharacterized protein LOC128957809 [Oppia nitens]|uniref:uncharacterized protein LOC128957809 n=1 Tax=Oppia nitens TaxID=1686743 RepID=UPI0023DBF4A9|nr:uncharacterized protein LOC128957809 [Oppia nitens]
MDEDREIRDENDISLLNTKYFTEKTCDLLNLKYSREVNTSMFTTNTSLDELPHYIVSHDINFDSKTLRSLLTRTDIKDVETVFYELLMILKKPHKQNKVTSFMFPMIAKCLSGYVVGQQKDIPITVWTQNGPHIIGNRPDYSLIKRNKVLLNIKLKSVDKTESMDNSKLQLFCQCIGSAQHNWRQINDKLLFNKLFGTQLGLLVISNTFHFFVLQITDQYIEELTTGPTLSQQISYNCYDNNGHGFDFFLYKDRMKVLSALSAIQSHHRNCSLTTNH